MKPATRFLGNASSRRDRRGAACCVVAAILLVPAGLGAQPKKPAAKMAPAAATPRGGSVEVTVVEVAGAQAYLRPGAGGGVHRGATVVLNRRAYAVVQTTESFAVIEVGHDPPHELDKGRASAVAPETDKVVELPPPRPLSTWKHAWQAQLAPASLQRPRFVPLGAVVEQGRRWEVRLTATGGALVPLGARGSTIARAELGARIHAEPFAAPAALDLDASLQRWFALNLDARAGAGARPALYVRELMASYAAGGFFAGLGRMRYAASTLGTLDGARAAAPLGAGVSIGAFGGLLPDPESGAFSARAERFGVEARYARPEVAWRPEAALVVHGSTFQGHLDERRVSGMLGLYPGASRLAAFFEVSAFDADNPWKAKPVELTMAGLDGSFRTGAFELNGHVDLRTPERSRWLGAALPLSWFCRTVPAPGGPDLCAGGTSTRVYGTVDAAVVLERASLIVGASAMRDGTDPEAPKMTGAFASGRVVKLAKIGRVEASGSYSRATYVDMWGGTVGPGIAIFSEALDVSAYYRRTILRYRSDPATLVQQAVGGTIMAIPSSTMALTLQGEAMVGRDTPALVLFGTVTWHPNL